MAENKEPQLNLQLPYEDITGLIGGQAFAKNNFKRGNDILVFKIPFEKISIWDGYNTRKVYKNIEEMAESLLEHGQITPFQLATLKDGRVFLIRGGRRYAGYQLLIEQKKFDPATEVPFFLTRANITMEELVVDLVTSNNYQEKLLPIENADNAYRLKYLCGKEKKNEDVAKLMGVSRQTVDNLILIAKADDYVKNEMRKGSMSLKEALEYIKKQKKGKEEADKKEEASRQSSLDISPQEDPLKKEVQELQQLEEEAEIKKMQEQHEEGDEAKENRMRLEKQRLLQIANEVYVSDTELVKHIGKKLAVPAIKEWVEDFVDEDTGETTSLDRKEVILPDGALIDEENIKILIETGVKVCFINKEITVAPSVITEPVAEKEKSKYDESRPEMAAIQGAIKCFDKLAAIAAKLPGVNEQTLKDIEYNVHWGQTNLQEAREWIHKHKQQNKSR